MQCLENRSRVAKRRGAFRFELLEVRRLLAADLAALPSDEGSGDSEIIQLSTGELSTAPLIQWEQRGLGTNLDWTVDPASAPVEAPFQFVEFDAATRTERVISAEESLAAMQQFAEIEKELNTQGFDGISGFLDAMRNPPGFDAGLSTDEGFEKNLVFGTDGRTEIGDTTVYPWRAMGRLWIDNNGFGNCSGTMVGPYQFLTAGHCVHSGPSETDGWAENLIVSAGQNGTRLGSGDQFRRSDYQYYGEANWTTATTFTGWSTSGSFDWDIALVKLDRNLGNHVGWLGYGYNSSDSYYTSTTAHTAGYPGDRTPNEFDMWYNFGNSRSHSATTNQLRTNTMDTWGGQSGSSLYVCIPDCSTLRSAHGVVSHHSYSDTNGNRQWDPGEPAFYNSFTRITQTKYNSLGTWMSSTAAPTDRADLIDWDQWFDSDVASMSSTTARPGSAFSVTTYPRNNGTASTGSYRVSFYASTNTTITSSDYLLGSVNMSSLAPFNWATATLSLSQFPDIPVGSYYVGWIIDSASAVSEYLEGNNTGYISTNRLTVDKALPDTMTTAEGMAYFFGGTANDIVDDTLSFNAFIDSPSDIDSFYFATDNSGTYTIDVGDFGNATNPMVAVYNATTGAKLGWDNDGGSDDDARLTLSLSSWTRYIVAVADYAETTTGDMSITITNSSPSSKSTITLDSLGDASRSSLLDNVADTDYYHFTAPTNASGNLDISVASGAGLNATFALWNRSTGALIATSSNGGTGGTDTLSITGVVPGTQYQLSILSLNYATQGSYDINLNFATLADTQPPAIVGVYAASSSWSAAFLAEVARGTGGNGNFGVGLGPNGLPLPWVGMDRLYVQFSEDVVGVVPGVVELRDSNGVLPISVTYNAATFMATIIPGAALTRSKLRLAINDTVADSSGNALDGDASGGAGGVFDLRFNVLPSDGNGDGRVNGGELSLFAAAFNSQIGQAAYRVRFDWNGDGRVNGSDLSVFSSFFNQSLDGLTEPGAPFSPGGTRLGRLAVDGYFAEWTTDDDEEDEKQGRQRF